MQHNIYFNNRREIKPSGDNLPFVQEYYIYEGRIIPDTMIKEKQAYDIVNVHPLLVINGFCVALENNNVLYITLFGIHPNKDPNTGNLCLPDNKIKKPFTEEYFDNLLKTIKTYYLDNSFVIPPSKYVTYKKINSIYIQLNKGEVI